MSDYKITIHIPTSLDRILSWPVLLLRRIWYGYAFRRIPLANSKRHAIVDAEDYEALSKYTWWVHRRKSLCKALRLTQEGGCQYPVYMHREIMFDLNPPSPRLWRTSPKPILRPEIGTTESRQIQNSNFRNSKVLVDHIDRDGLNNQRSNLRLATSQQNNMNRRFKKGTSKYKGVFFHRQSNRWRAKIGFNHKRIHLGNFENEIEAAKAYDEAAKKYYKEFAYLNFPPERKKKGLKSILDTIFRILNRLPRPGFLLRKSKHRASQ